MKFIFIYTQLSHGAPSEEIPEEAIEEIVVTGTRTPRSLGDAPVAVEVIDRDDIEASGSRDVAELLEQQPGIDIQRSFLGAGLRLRGLEADHTLLLIDGQRIVGRKDGTYDLSRIPVDAIERIEIVKGASSALYGSDALGGVVHIITRRASDPAEADLSARGGQPRSVDASAGLGVSGDQGSLRLDAGWHGSPAWDHTPETPSTTGNALQQLDLGGNGTWRLSPDLSLLATGRWSAVDASGVDGAIGGAVLDRRNLTEDALATVGVDWLLGTTSRWKTTAGLSIFRDQYAVDQRDAGDLDNYQDTREQLLQLQTQLDRVIGIQVWSLGLEGFTSQIASERLEGGSGTRQRGGAYLQDEIRILQSPTLVLVPGIRGDLDSWFGGALAPSLGLRFDPVEQLTLRGSVGTGWRAPSFRELLLSFDNSAAGYRVEGNDALRPERSFALSAGLEWVPADQLSASVQLHRDRLQDLIQIGTLDEVPGLTRFGYINVSSALSQGAELGVSLDPSKRLGLDTSLTLLQTRDLTLDRPLEGRAAIRSTAGLRAGIGAKGPRLTFRGVFVGPRPFFNGDTRTDAAPYALLDARIAQQLSESLDLSLGAENLLDAGDPATLPTPPRLLYAGIDARLP